MAILTATVSNMAHTVVLVTGSDQGRRLLKRFLMESPRPIMNCYGVRTTFEDEWPSASILDSGFAQSTRRMKLHLPAPEKTLLTLVGYILGGTG